MSELEILNEIYEYYREFKGIEVMIYNIEHNETFKKIIIEGFKSEKIKLFDSDILDKMSKLNIRGSSNLVDAFKTGATIGACTTASKYLSYIFYDCSIAGGTNSFLIGTKNSNDGEHTWVVGPDNRIYDTTFMLVIDRTYEKELGYSQENICNPNLSGIYRAGKEFANDTSIRR